MLIFAEVEILFPAGTHTKSRPIGQALTWLDELNPSGELRVHTQPFAQRSFLPIIAYHLSAAEGGRNFGGFRRRLEGKRTVKMRRRPKNQLNFLKSLLSPEKPLKSLVWAKSAQFP